MNNRSRQQFSGLAIRLFFSQEASRVTLQWLATNREQDFGLLISTVLPGFIALLGISGHSATLQVWMGQSGADAPSLGGFLFLTVISIFAGLTVGTIRWAVIDSIHHWTGLRQPQWDFSQLKNREQGFTVLIEIHYRYYQFYSNSLVAIACFMVGRWTVEGFSIIELIGWLAISGLFLAGSRDTLRKYYERVEALLAA